MKQLHSLVEPNNRLALWVAEVDQPTPRANEVLIKIAAAPINPSDLGLLLAGADPETFVREGDRTIGVMSDAAFAAVQARLGEATPVGNEGGGTVVGAGDSSEAQALMGKVVGAVGGAMYGEYRCVPAASVIPMNKGVSPIDAASCFVNPLTALGMVDTMRAEGHTALVHTAAASNLGKMLVKICQADGVELVNIVRRPGQVSLLRSMGAKWVVDSSASTFKADLLEALRATGATIAFDATGGGKLASDILSAMERAASAGQGYSRYGSTTHKQVYLYGGLDTSPTVLTRSFGMAWGIGGWLLTPFLLKTPPTRVAELRARVANEITTTFASAYTAKISLEEALDPETIRAYGAKATGSKYLLVPS
jgi:NADPH:quinone reductase